MAESSRPFSLRTPAASRSTTQPLVVRSEIRPYGRIAENRRHRASLCRPSDAHLNRLSIPRTSMLGSTNLQAKTTRNIRDRDYIERQKAVIRRFLIKTESSIDPKVVSHASISNFTLLFKYVYSHLDSEFTFTKIQSEAMTILKAYGYPVTLRQSTFENVGAPSAWPQVIDAISWLIDVVEGDTACSIGDLLGTNNENDLESLRRGYAYSFFTTAYKKSLLEPNIDHSFSEEAQAIERGLLEKLNLDQDGTDSQLTKLKREHEAIQMRLERAEQNLVIEKQAVQHLQTDVQNLDSYLQGVQEFITTKENDLVRSQTEANLVTQKCEALTLSNAEMKHRIASQKMKPVEAREAASRLILLREQLRSLAVQQQELVSKPSEAQCKSTKALQAIGARFNETGNFLVTVAERVVPKNEVQALGVYDLVKDVKLASVEDAVACLDNFSRCSDALVDAINRQTDSCVEEVKALEMKAENYENELLYSEQRQREMESSGNRILKATGDKIGNLRLQKAELDAKESVIIEKRGLEADAVAKLKVEVHASKMRYSELSKEILRVESEHRFRVQDIDEATDTFMEGAIEEVEEIHANNDQQQAYLLTVLEKAVKQNDQFREDIEACKP